MNEFWFYEYDVKIYDDFDNKEACRQGILSAESYSDAAAQLEEYYGDELLSIETLKLLFEGPCFEFQLAKDESTFGFDITRKL